MIVNQLLLTCSIGWRTKLPTTLLCTIARQGRQVRIDNLEILNFDAPSERMEVRKSRRVRIASQNHYQFDLRPLSPL